MIKRVVARTFSKNASRFSWPEFRSIFTSSQRTAFLTAQKILPIESLPTETVVILLDEGGPKCVEEVMRRKTSALTSLFWPLPIKSMVKHITQHPTYVDRWMKNFFGGEFLCLKLLHEMGLIYEQNLEQMRSNLQEYLNRLMPEFGSFKCYSAKTSCHDSLQNTMQLINQNNEASRVIFVVMSCLWSPNGQSCVENLSKCLGIAEKFKNIKAGLKFRERTFSSFNSKNGIAKWPNIKNWTVVDCHPFHPALSDVYVQEIKKEMCKFPYDVRYDVSLLFCAPMQMEQEDLRRMFEEEISAGCTRIVENLGLAPPPHCVAYYKPWTSYSPFWGFSDDFWGMRKSVRFLCKTAGRPNILLVPLDCFTGLSLNTEIVLKQAFNAPNLGLHRVQHLRHMQPPVFNSTLNQGLAEIIKSHILTIDEMF